MTKVVQLRRQERESHGLTKAEKERILSLTESKTFQNGAFFFYFVSPPKYLGIVILKFLVLQHFFIVLFFVFSTFFSFTENLIC